MENGVLHTRTLVRCVNVGFLVVGAVALFGGGGLQGCSSKSTPASPENDAAGSTSSSSSGGSGGSSGASYGGSNGPDGSATIFAGGGPLAALPPDADSCSGGACNGLTITDAPVVEETLVPGSPPAFTGGTLANGTYYLTSVLIYGGDAGGSTVSEALVAEDGGGSASGDDASGEDAIADGASLDGTIADGASSGDASVDGATTDGPASIGTPNGSFVEMVFSISDNATIAQLASLYTNGCTFGTVHLNPAGSMLAMAPFCGNPFSPTESSGMTWPYTATATTITASVPVGGGATAVLTLTLQ
jgi:hypothetical protein